MKDEVKARLLSLHPPAFILPPSSFILALTPARLPPAVLYPSAPPRLTLLLFARLKIGISRPGNSLVELHRHERGVGLDAVPEILEGYVLVLGVLVVVVVGDGDCDRGRAQRLAYEREREAAAQRRHPHDGLAGGGLHGLDDGARDGQVHRRALGVVAARPVRDAGDEGVRRALRVSRVVVGDVEALAAYVRDEPLDLSAEVVAAHQAQVE